MTNEEYLLTTLLGCGIADIDKMSQLMSELEDVGGSFEDALSTYTTEEGVKFGDIAYACMNETNFVLAMLMQRAELITEQQAEKIRDDFEPFINYLDTWYNNKIDELSFDGTPEEIAKRYYELIKESL